MVTPPNKLSLISLMIGPGVPLSHLYNVSPTRFMPPAPYLHVYMCTLQQQQLPCDTACDSDPALS